MPCQNSDLLYSLSNETGTHRLLALLPYTSNIGRGSVGRDILCFLLPDDEDEDDESFGSEGVVGTLPVDALLVNHFVGFDRNWVKPIDGDVDLAKPGDDGGWFGLNESLVDSEFNVPFLFGAISALLPRFSVVVRKSWRVVSTWLACNASSGAIMSKIGLFKAAPGTTCMPCCRTGCAAHDYGGNMEVETKLQMRNQLCLLATDFQLKPPSSPLPIPDAPLSGATE